MRYSLTVALLLLAFTSLAQTKITRIALQINTGVGISNKPGVMFGAPFYLSGDLGVTLNERWRIAFEGGAMAFRDSKNPNDKIGLIFSSYPRYDHQYFGLRISRNVLNVVRAQQLFVSSGANYLLIVDPNVQRTSGFGFFSGSKYFNYQYRRYLNIPVQADYSMLPFRGKRTRLTFSSRWNFNAYHSFPTFSIGINIPIFTLKAG